MAFNVFETYKKLLAYGVSTYSDSVPPVKFQRNKQLLCTGLRLVLTFPTFAGGNPRFSTLQFSAFPEKVDFDFFRESTIFDFPASSKICC